MRALHFDCVSGISGDMTLAALLDLGADAVAVRAGLASLGLPITLTSEPTKRCGLAATQVTIDAPAESRPRFLPHIEETLRGGHLSPPALDIALRIFRTLADAEATVHGIPAGRVHFHEVGALDSIADIAGVAVAIDTLKIDLFTCGPVPTGYGTVKCDHGVMPVPAPATAVLLKDVPLAPVEIAAELTTPTGAAILKTLVTAFTPTPAMTVRQVGHGAGRRDFPNRPNVLRLLLGDAADAAGDTVWLLETNLDDVPGEVVGYAFERLLAAGALDVWTTPVQMKKQRPGVVVSVLATDATRLECERVLFAETGTLGVRRSRVERTTLQRDTASVELPWGPVRVKRAWDGRGHAVATPEYDDCRRLAVEHDVPLRTVLHAADAAARALPAGGGAQR